MKGLSMDMRNGDILRGEPEMLQRLREGGVITAISEDDAAAAEGDETERRRILGREIERLNGHLKKMAPGSDSPPARNRHERRKQAARERRRSRQ